MNKAFSLILAFLFFTAHVKAQSSAFAYRVNLNGVNSTWHSLRLPTSVLAKAQIGLEDIRIYGFTEKDTIEVPYILEKSANQIVQRESDFRIINESKEPGVYYYTFQATNPAIINHINLSFKQNNFDWIVTLEGSNNNEQWFNILDDYRLLAIQNKHTKYRFTELNFPDSKYVYYRIKILSTVVPELTAAKMLKTDTLVGLTEPIAYQRYQLVNDNETKQSIINVHLKQVELLSGINLQIGSDFDFYRRIKIEVARDSTTTEQGIRYHYQSVFEGTLSSLEKTNFNFEAILAKQLRITIENDDNKPLRLKSFALNGAIYELIARFDHSDYNYALFFGNKTTVAPIYELKNFEQKIPLLISPISLEKIQPNPDFIIKTQKPIFENKAWLWAVMGLIISILGFFTYKMLKD